MTQRLLIGDYGDGTSGMKLSLPGYNVATAGPRELVFDTKWPGAGTVHATGSSTIGATISFPALSYVPMVLASPYDPSTGNLLSPCWGSNNPNTYRWAANYHTRVAGGAVFSVTTNSLTFLSIPSGFTPSSYYTHVRYIIYRIGGV